MFRPPVALIVPVIGYSRFLSALALALVIRAWLLAAGVGLDWGFASPVSQGTALFLVSYVTVYWAHTVAGVATQLWQGHQLIRLRASQLLLAHVPDLALYMVLCLLVLVQVPHLVHVHSWAARGDSAGTIGVSGTLLQWEWEVFQHSSQLLEGYSLGSGSREVVRRIVPPYLVSMANVLTRDRMASVLLLSTGFWCIAAMAARLFASRLVGKTHVGWLMALLVATGPGFAAVYGQYDIHQFAYAWILLTLLLVGWLQPFSVGRHGLERGAIVALSFVLVGLTYELHVALLAFCWLYYGVCSRWCSVDVRDPAEEQPPHNRIERMPAPKVSYRWLSLSSVTLATFALLAVWDVALGPLSVRDSANDPLRIVLQRYVFEASTFEGVVSALSSSIMRLVEAYRNAFGFALLALALLGITALPERWRWWCASLLVVITAGALVTKAIPRTVYVAYPAVYLASAAGASVLGHMVAQVLISAKRRERSWLQNRRTRPLIAAAVSVSILLAAIMPLRTDLVGDAAMPRAWWHHVG